MKTKKDRKKKSLLERRVDNNVLVLRAMYIMLLFSIYMYIREGPTQTGTFWGVTSVFVLVFSTSINMSIKHDRLLMALERKVVGEKDGMGL